MVLDLAPHPPQRKKETGGISVSYSYLGIEIVSIETIGALKRVSVEMFTARARLNVINLS